MKMDRSEDALLLDLQVQQGATSQGMKATLRCWKRQGDRFSLRTFRRNTALPTSDLQKEDTFVLFEAVTFVANCP